MNDWNESISTELKLVIDHVCDEAERALRGGRWPGLDPLLIQVHPRGWKFLVRELINTLCQVKPELSEAQLRQLLATQQADAKKIVGLAIEEYRAAPSQVQLDASQTVVGRTTSKDDDVIPEKIDHFHVVKELGVGGFGRVFLARDALLKREVVIKLPRADKFTNRASMEIFLDEASKVATLEHPGIVAVHHVGMYDGRPFIVQQYISGGDLGEALQRRTYSYAETAELLSQIAGAVAYAHQKRIVHRDLKPANILLDEAGRPRVADFGLAIHESQQGRAVGEIAGTPKYMSPEQVRGEAHRLDGRSDVWSLGILLYRMLVGETPFRSSDPDEIRDQITHQQPRPPRQLMPQIPAELERICLKCLAKKMNERYSTAVDLADDLREWLKSQNAGETPPLEKSGDQGLRNDTNSNAGSSRQEGTARTAAPAETHQVIVPKGLVAFDSRDQKFFLQLLPGPRDRQGLPEQVRFWKERLESTDPEEAFQVGLIYGPSGCGKSSLVRAGILPRLPSNIRTVYVEATQADTEVRLLVGLRKHFPEIPRGLALPQIIAQLRQGKWLALGDKIVLVLDQFEQWLHANDIQVTNQLVEALRHCDGQTVQALVLARDDFWMAVSRFFQELELPLAEQKNFAAVDLFDTSHARNVLTMFGQAYGRLPTDGNLAVDQNKFLDDAIRQLAEQDKINCVRLVLFAETMKSKPWTIESLRQLGNVHQIGTLFLEQTLDARIANPRYRRHGAAIRQILEKLLPEAGTEIKAHFRSTEELAEAAGMPQESSEFQSTIEVLDASLRLITPTEPDFGTASAKTVRPNHETRYYQLTHDFLVPSIREWLRLKENETWKGRAREQFRILHNNWNVKKEKRFLPSFFEFPFFWLAIDDQRLTQQQRSFFLSARRSFLQKIGVMILLVAFLVLGSIWTRRNGLIADTKSNIASVLSVNAAVVPIYMDKVLSQKTIATKLIDQWPTPDNPIEHLRFLYLKATLTDRPDATTLVAEVENAPPNECQNFVDVLRSIVEKDGPELVHGALEDALSSTPSHVQKSRLLILALHLGFENLPEQYLGSLEDTNFRSVFIYQIPDWHANVTDILDAARDSKKPDVQYELIAGLSLLMDKSATDVNRELIIEFLKSMVRRTSDSGVAMVCQQILEKSDPQAIEILRSNTVSGKDFEIVRLANFESMVFVRIEPGEALFGAGQPVGDYRQYGTANSKVSSPFLIASKEVSLDLYSQFVESLSFNSQVKLDFCTDKLANHTNCLGQGFPIAGITRNEAVQFCNWLSAEMKLENAYHLVGEEWVAIEGSNGYRLPTVAEWEIAYRAGAKTMYQMGDASLIEFLPNYAWCGLNEPSFSFNTTGKCGAKLPNRLGMFDMMGNAAEWAHDSFNNIGEAQKSYAIRGGNARDSFATFAATWYIELPGRFRSQNAGIRLVRPVLSK